MSEELTQEDVTAALKEREAQKYKPDTKNFGIKWDNVKTIEDYNAIWQAIGLTLQFDMNQMAEHAEELIKKNLIEPLEDEQ